ncbi:MAG: thiol:disulfide interchange protein DsbA/DsbL [Nitrosomonas sp.]|nr:thiol:disulfide interchange protein DsbA/DsbL [Nitrosomonas sp.]
MNLYRVIVTLSLLIWIGCSSVQADIIEGKDYTVLSDPQPTNSSNKIEVINFFWYGCQYCAQLRPQIKTWLENKPDDIEFQEIPAIIHVSWIPAAKLFLTVQQLNAMDTLHNQAFSAIHQDNMNLHEEPSLFHWIETQGKNRDEFINTYQSIDVQKNIARSTYMTRQYQITGVPAIVVNGKYMTNTRMGGTAENTMTIVDQLIKKTRQEKTTK